MDLTSTVLELKERYALMGHLYFQHLLTEKWINNYEENLSVGLCDGFSRAYLIMKIMRVLSPIQSIILKHDVSTEW